MRNVVADTFNLLIDYFSKQIAEELSCGWQVEGRWQFAVLVATKRYVGAIQQRNLGYRQSIQLIESIAYFFNDLCFSVQSY